MNDKKYIPGYGPLGAKIMILGECPNYDDIQKPFTKSRELDTLLKEANINKGNCWLSTVSKYHISPNIGKKKIPFAIRAKNEGIDIHKQLEELQNEINGIKPNVILGVGKTALWALTGKTNIENYRGSILLGMGRKFIPSYNPDHLNWHATDIEFKGYWNRPIILFDYKRVLNQSYSSDIILPQRTLQIAKSSYDLAQFRDLYKLHTKMSVDIEAAGHCLPVCIGIAFNKSHGMCVPLWNTDGISNIPDADLIQIWIILAELLSIKDIIGQNFNYDRDKIRRLGFTINRLVSDTMLKAHAINPELPKRLAFNQSIFTDEPFYKDEGMYEGSITDLLIGCARDACVTYEIDENMNSDLDELGQRSFYENFLMRLPEFYLAIENQGFNIDTKQRDFLIHKYVEWDEHLRYELFKLTGTEINVNSPKQISILLYDNYKLPRREGTGEEELTALLNNQTNGAKLPEHRKTIELILEDRRVRKSVNTYLMALPDYDSRMRTTYYPCLETGRSSTGQQDPPIRPIIEVIGEDGKIKKKSLGAAFQTMTKHGDVGQDIRSMYIPDSDGEIFIQADSAQAEVRIVFLLADDEQALYDIDHHDYHALTASWFFGGIENDYSKKVIGYESPIRFAGKRLRNAGHLGVGKRRAAISVNTDARKFKIPIAITEAIAERALKIFHSKQPKIQSVFHTSVIKCLEKNRQLYAPVPFGIDSPIGGKRTFFERWGDELFRQAFSYIPQRTISDNTKGAGLRIKERIPNIKIVLESHDSLLFCINKSDVEHHIPIIKQEFERPIDFRTCCIQRRSLIIPCEIEIGNNYQEFSKYQTVIKQSDVIPIVIPQMPPKTITEQFLAPLLGQDSKLTDIIYREQERKLNI